MSRIDQALLLRFATLAAERLDGDWVLMGGTVLPLLGVEHRVTLDIDIAGPDAAGNRELLTLMDIADELGLPVETINQAAAFFLHRISGWCDQLVEVCRGSRGRLLRPDATLFVQLKLARLSESDLSDCLEMLQFAQRSGEKVDVDRLLAVVDQRRIDEVPDRQQQRLDALVAALGRL